MKHQHQNLFVIIVGLAAWIHSTWSFSVVIGGEVPNLAGPVDIPRWLYWVLPGAAAAAAVDVGLISLAASFRGGRGNRAKLITFGVLSFISYLGQALFSLSHGGRYVPSSGLSPISVTVASIVWEVLIWALPAALPITLILWAWSDMRPAATLAAQDQPAQDSATLAMTVRSELATTLPPDTTIELPDTKIFTEICADCGQEFKNVNRGNARRALAAHKQFHCTKINAMISANGNGPHEDH